MNDNEFTQNVVGSARGIIVSLQKYAESIKKAVFPGITSSHHLHHVAGKAIALAESLEFGKDYAIQVIKNAKTIAGDLANLGFEGLGEKKDTRHHINLR